jgi:Golgi nucleoside diphosphatase
MKHQDDIYFYFAFVICIGFTIILLGFGVMDNRNKKLQAQIDELRVIFNQKFLQEMIVNKPTVRFEF